MTFGFIMYIYKVKLLGTWIKRREVVYGPRRIRTEKLREHQYKEGYARSFEGEEIVRHQWEQVKLAMVGSARGGEETNACRKSCG